MPDFSTFAMIGGGIIALLVLVMMIASRIRIPAPNEALIIAGSGTNAAANDDDGKIAAASDLKIVTGGKVIVPPFTQKVYRISLEQRKFNVTAAAFTNNHIRLNVKAVAAIKVDDNANAIRLAAQRFLGEEDRIVATSEEVLEGALRSIIGTMDADTLNKDREAFAKQAEEIAVSSLKPQGLRIDSFHIQDIEDESDYLRNLSRPEEAEAQRNADVAEETARRAAEIARIEADQNVMESQRNLDLRQASIAEETASATARAEAAGPLAEAQANAAVVEQQENTARRKAELREQELDAEVRRPAAAARYAANENAEAKKAATISAAEAEADRLQKMAQAERAAEIFRSEAEAERTTRQAQAEKEASIAQAEAEAQSTERLSNAELLKRKNNALAIREEGEAEAASILARGEAEAEALQKKAEAYSKMGPVALADHFISMMPELVTAAGKPMESIDSLTVIDSDGASKVVKSGLSNITQITDLGKALFNVDLSEVLGNVSGSDAAGTSETGNGVAAQEPETV